jgi:hypothetical protein
MNADIALWSNANTVDEATMEVQEQDEDGVQHPIFHAILRDDADIIDFYMHAESRVLFRRHVEYDQTCLVKQHIRTHSLYVHLYTPHHRRSVTLCSGVSLSLIFFATKSLLSLSFSPSIPHYPHHSAQCIRLVCTHVAFASAQAPSSIYVLIDLGIIDDR